MKKTTRENKNSALVLFLLLFYLEKRRGYEKALGKNIIIPHLYPQQLIAEHLNGYL